MYVFQHFQGLKRKEALALDEMAGVLASLTRAGGLRSLLFGAVLGSTRTISLRLSLPPELKGAPASTGLRIQMSYSDT